MKASISISMAHLQLEQDKASCTVCGMKTLERWEIKQESEGEKELVDTNWLIGCWVVEERLPFWRVMDKESDAGRDTGSEDSKEDGGGARIDGQGQRI
jgi:hypothetical protein